jgi:hypothetical protein
MRRFQIIEVVGALLPPASSLCRRQHHLQGVCLLQQPLLLKPAARRIRIQLLKRVRPVNE